MNLNLFVLTQPICIILRLFTASLHNTAFLARHEETQWLRIREMECFAVTCTRASEGRRISHLLRSCHLCTCRQGVQSCPSDACWHVRLQLYRVCNCSASLLKLNRQREGLIFHRISAVTLSSSSPYLGWIKCTMNLYSKWTGNKSPVQARFFCSVSRETYFKAVYIVDRVSFSSKRGHY